METKPRTMTAKFPGTCKVCRSRFEAGTEIVWQKGQGARHADTAACAAAAKQVGRQKAEQAKLPQLDLSALPSGRYAAGDLLLAIDNLAEAEGRWHGWVFVQKMLDHTNKNREKGGYQKPDGTYRGPHTQALAEILKDPQAAMVAFGKQTGHCGICGKLLTDPESIAHGIGPVCAANHGWHFDDGVAA